MARDTVRTPIVAMITVLAVAGCSPPQSADPPGPAPAGRSTPSRSPGTTSVASPAGSATASPTAGPPTGAPTNTASADAQPRETPAPARGSARVTGTVARGLNVPWGLALLPDGDLLVASRDTARITRIDLTTRDRTLLGRVDGVAPGGEGGLLGLAVSPRFDRDRHLFVYYTTEQDNRIVRLSYRPDRPAADQLGDRTVILDGIPHGAIHNGGRLAFGPDGMLYASTGEAGDPSLSQDLGSLGGKILRMTPSGRPAEGNPDPDSVVWSYGHRNVQGLAWDVAGRLWASEFGSQSADELNLIKPDHNYGWPDTEGRTDDPRYTGPVAQWGTDEDSPSGIAYAGGSIWMAALRGERLWRIPLDGSRAGRPQEFLTGEHGRLRSVVALDDHTILVSTSNTDGRAVPGPEDDRILRLTVR